MANGSIHADNVTFPSGMKALATYVHSKGLRFGCVLVHVSPVTSAQQWRAERRAWWVAVTALGNDNGVVARPCTQAVL